MSEFYGFFNGGTEYGQEEFNRYFDNIYHSGISANDDGTMQYPISVGNKSVTVGEGFAILKGFYHYNDSNKTLAMEADPNLPRLCRAAIRLNIAESRTYLAVLKGTAASSPVAPALTRSKTIYEISLGTYRVEPSGKVSLVSDDRYKPDLCGLVRPKNLQEYTETMKSLQKKWEDWFKAQQGQGQRKVFVQTNNPSEAVSGSIWIQEVSE